MKNIKIKCFLMIFLLMFVVFNPFSFAKIVNSEKKSYFSNNSKDIFFDDLNDVVYKKYYPGVKPEPNVVYYQDEYVIVDFKKDLIDVLKLTIFEGYAIVDIIPELNSGLLHASSFPPGVPDIFSFLEYLIKINGVENAELNTLCYESPMPTGVAEGQLWAHEMMNIPQAWSKTTGLNGVEIAIIDSGYDHNHLGLPSIDKEIDFVEQFPLFDLEANDITGHGTKITGIVHSVVPNCRFYSVKITEKEGGNDYGLTWKWIFAKGVIHAAKPVTKLGFGADILCIAIVDSDFNSQEETCILGKACEKARNEYNAIIIAAPRGVSNTDKLGAPAKYSTTICVGAIDEDGNIFSSPSGPEIDLVAPGTNIYTTKKGNDFTYISGTSAACAFVAGIAGLFYSNKKIRNPNTQDLRDCESALVGSAEEHDMGNSGFDNTYGWGLVDAWLALTKSYNLIVDFTWNRENPKVDQLITFTSKSRDPDGILVNFAWDFKYNSGDDNWGRVVTYSYSSPGSYKVKLWVESSDGQSKQKIKTINIGKGKEKILNNQINSFLRNIINYIKAYK